MAHAGGFGGFVAPPREKVFMVDIVDTEAAITLHSFFMYSIDEVTVLREVKKYFRDGLVVKVYKKQYVEINDCVYDVNHFTNGDSAVSMPFITSGLSSSTTRPSANVDPAGWLSMSSHLFFASTFASS